MTHRSLDDPEFLEQVTLKDAYRIMQVFTESYLNRGDGSISDFLNLYMAEVQTRQSTDPAALEDFLGASKRIGP